MTLAVASESSSGSRAPVSESVSVGLGFGAPRTAAWQAIHWCGRPSIGAAARHRMVTSSPLLGTRRGRRVCAVRAHICD